MGGLPYIVRMFISSMPSTGCELCTTLWKHPAGTVRLFLDQSIVHEVLDQPEYPQTLATTVPRSIRRPQFRNCATIGLYRPKGCQHRGGRQAEKS